MKIQNKDGTITAAIDPGTEALYRTLANQRGIGFSSTATTGQIPANFAANSNFWGMRNGFGGPSSHGTVVQIVDRIRIKYTNIAVAVALTSTRIQLFRGGGTQPITFSGGTAMIPIAKRSLSPTNTGQLSASYADMRLMTTTSLTATNVTLEATAIRGVDFFGVSLTPAAFVDTTWEFSDYEAQGLVLLPGQCLIMRNPAVWANQFHQLQVDVDYREVLVDPIYKPS